MAYEAWERAHDENLIKTLRSAVITEEQIGSHTLIRLAHLTGEVYFVDGTMVWCVYGFEDIGGEKLVDQQNIDRSAKELRNYGRKAVASNLEKIAKQTIASATKRLEAAQ